MNEHERIRRASESLPDLHAITDEVLRLSARIGSSMLTTGDVEHDAKERAGSMAISYVGKQDEHLQSLTVLVRAGQHRDAFLIARTMVEGMVQLRWAHDNKPDGPDRWFWYDVVEDWRQLERNRADGLTIEPGSEAAIKRLLARYGTNYYTGKATRKASTGHPLPADPYRREWINLDAASVFRKLQCSSLYESVYRRASDWVHWSPRSMLLATSEEGGIQRHKIEDPPRASQALAVGIMSHLESLEVVNTHFQLRLEDEITTLRTRLSEVLRQALRSSEEG